MNWDSLILLRYIHKWYSNKKDCAERGRMKNQKICSSIVITYEIVGDGLVGNEQEKDSYAAIHTSFNPYRVKMIDPLVRIREIPTAALSQAVGAADDQIIRMGNKIAVYKSKQPLEIVPLDYDQMKGDDTIHFKLFSHTNHSGVESIDKSEAKYVKRQIADGVTQLTLHNLFKFYKANFNKTSTTSFTITDQFEDQKVIDEKTRDLLETIRNPTDAMVEKMMEKAKPLCYKASVTFTITVNNFNETLYRKSIFSVPDLTVKQYSSMLPLKSRRGVQEQHLESLATPYTNNSVITQSKPLGVPLHTKNRRPFESALFNSEKTWEVWVKVMGDCLDRYCEHFIESDDGIQPFYQPFEPAVSNLQLPQYMSEFGKMLVYAYWGNPDPYYREYASEEARLNDLRLYGFDARTEEFFLMMLRSAIRRFGLTEETFLKEVEHHFSPQNTATLPSPGFLRVEQALAHVGTFAANMADYTADFRFAVESKGGKPGSHESTHKNVGEMRTCPVCGKELVVKEYQLDSWDNNILNNTSKCDDCEGQDNTATTVLRSFAIGRPDLEFNWASPLLQAAKKLLDHSVVFDVGALVTSAFMDTNNKKIEEKQEDLPLIGSEMDKNAQNDGHCFGLLQSLSRCIRMLQAGNIKKDVVAKVITANLIAPLGSPQQKAYEERDYRRSTLVLEPTGSIEARLLSLEESYDSGACDDGENRLLDKVKGMYYFMKELRNRLKVYEKDENEENPDNNSINDLFVGEGLPHYVKRQVAQRRVSSFYNSVVHGTSVDLMRFDPTLTQFAFCTNGKYGVRMGALIADRPNSKLSLVSPYANYDDQLVNEVIPMIESIQNQMAISKFGRYNEEEYKNELYSRYIPADEMSATLNFDAPLPWTPEREAKQKKFEALLKEVDSDQSDKTVVRLYSRVWKLNQKKEKTERLNAFIKAMPGLIDYSYYVERHIPVCDPIVEILCIIDVKQALSFSPTTQ